MLNLAGQIAFARRSCSQSVGGKGDGINPRQRWLRYQCVCFFALLIGLAVHARLRAGEPEVAYPVGIAGNAAGEMYLADRNLPGVWKLTDSGPKVFWQGAKQFGKSGNAPRCIAVSPQGAVYLGDSATREILRVSEGEAPQPLTGGAIGVPVAMVFDASGHLIVADLEQHRIWTVDPASTSSKPLLKELCSIQAPRSLARNAQGELLVLSQGKDLVVKVAPDGKQSVVVKGQPLPEKSFATALAVGTEGDLAGELLVADGYLHTVWAIAPEKEPRQLIADPVLVNPSALLFQEKALWIVDPRSKAAGPAKVFHWANEKGLLPWPGK